METIQTILIITILACIAYIAISKAIKFKKSGKSLPDKVYQLIGIIYPILSRQSLIHKYINEERAKERLIIIQKNVKLREWKKKMLKEPLPLKADKKITLLAKNRVIKVDAANYISHDRVFVEFLVLKKDGSDGEAEIIAGFFRTPKGTVNGWMNSPGHREALLKADYDYLGIGCRYDTTPPVDNPDRRNLWIDDALFVDESTVN